MKTSTQQKHLNFIEHSFNSLGNGLRLKIFLKILEEGCQCNLSEQEGLQGNCVTSVMEELDIPQSTASMYIKSLRDADLIECHKNGKFLYCKPKKDALLKMKIFIDSLVLQME